MLGARLQVLVLLAAIALGVASYRSDHAGLAGMAFAGAGVLLFGVVRHGGVMAAGRHYRNGRKDAAWAELRRVPLRGRLLSASFRAYFHLLRAATLMDRERWADVEPECRAVLALTRVRKENHATAHAALAKSKLELGDREAARRHAAIARTLPRKPGLDSLIVEVEEALAEDAPPSAAR